jgi:exosome complex component RRP42
MVGLSEGEKHFIRGGIAQDLRADGRTRLQFRAVTVETGIIPQVSEESSRVPQGLLPWPNLSFFGLVAVGERLGAC